MSGFKLLAIVPLKGCSSKYRKNLQIGVPYKFYQSHDIKLNKDKTKIVSVDELENYNVPKELYKLNNGINVNVSAVVGKNGTGKSTLFELFYLLVYLIGTKKSNGEDKVIKKRSDDLKGYLEELNTDIDLFEEKHKLFAKDPNLFNLKNANILSIISIIEKYELKLIPYNYIKKLKYLLGEGSKRLLDKKKETEHELKQEKEKEKHIEEKFSIGVVYSINDIIYTISYCNEALKFNRKTDTGSWVTYSVEELDFSELFYSVSLNYSHHSLNSNNLGNWITKLFHKNDGYITPVVINPMRNKGNFDINDELNLSKERLMTNAVFNIINDQNYLLLGKYKIDKFVFSLKEKLYPSALGYGDDNYFNSLKSSTLLKEKAGITRIDDYIDYWDYAVTYLENKISKIERNYKRIIYREENTKNTLNNFLLSDKSHITKKLRQVTNFLKKTKKIGKETFWKKTDDSKELIIDSSSLIDWIKLFDLDLTKTSPSELVEYALPSFFNIDFKLKHIEDTEGEGMSFGDLSSGEQQMILNTNSILYHLYNLQSVHSEETDRVKYKNINIILDEVELYYHPEMQRLLINDLLESFSYIKRNKEIGIEAINVCILTHSPFILSDIPASNVLRLKSKEDVEKENEVQIKQTFGANVHDLLVDSFFISSTIGDFSKEKINEFIKKLNEAIKNRNNKKPRLLKNSIKELEALGGQPFIELIGDSLIKDKLLQMYFLATEKSDKEGLKKYYQKKLENLN